MDVSRRLFVQGVTASGIALTLMRLAAAAPPDFLSRETLPGRVNWNPAGAGRIDGVVKVSGAKLYASDFRAADMPGWPAETAHAILVRANDATHVYKGLDLARLTGALKPTAVITADDLKRAGTRVPEFYAGDLFCPAGTTPLYLGQPVALLIFATFDSYDEARIAIRDTRGFVQFGEETGALTLPHYAAFRFTRVAGTTPDAPDVYSPVMAGWVSPGKIQDSERPVWTPQAISATSPYGKAAVYGEQIRAGLAAGGLMLDRDFETQSVDPMFLEPETGLAWFDKNGKTLEIVLGAQSPYDAAESMAFMLGKATFKPAAIKAQFAYMGGGFGGRDHTPFPLYVALAGMFFPGRPVRLAQDRFQQFQGGIKRHAFKMRTLLGVDRATGKITGFAADHVLDGGGLANYSSSVATVSATAAIGIYDIPKVDVTTVAVHSRGVTAGSMRCYGTLQTMTALETIIDEAAAALPLDPIEFRRRNALTIGGRTMAGNPYSVSVRTPEILDKLEGHAIWKQRAVEKLAARPGFVIGTGVAVACKDYGTGGDCSLSSVEINAQGRISIHCDHVDMGNGIGTAAAARVAAHLGAYADEVTVHQIDTYSELGLTTSGNSYAMDQKTQDTVSRNPRWVPAISSATAASNGAHVGTHAAAEAARIIFRFGLWPAALELWTIKASDARAAQWQAATWKDGHLSLPGLAPLSLALLAAKAHARNHVTGAMTHAFSRWAWAEATFPVAGTKWTGPIDALALRNGRGKFTRINRSAVKYPPTNNNRFGTTYTSQCGTLVRIEIERATGALRIAKAYSVLECGKALVPGIVLGQAQGGFAMGVGYTLFEHLPPYEDGPGNGQWNLGQYVVARGSDLPLHDLEVEVLPPVSPDEQPKGMAEVCVIPVVAALLNAMHDATGERFQSLPVTPAMLKGAFA